MSVTRSPSIDLVVLLMPTDKVDRYAFEAIRGMRNQPVLVAAEIEDIDRYADNSDRCPMRYRNGKIVAVGDKVKLWEGCAGVVVCSIDTDEYTDAYPEIAWTHLAQGILVRSDKAGLIHYVEPDEDFEPL